MLRNKFYFISNIYFIVCLGFLWSQTHSISGTILNFETEEPINGVNIYIKNSDIGTITNQEGFFVLYLNEQLENNIDLNIEMIGYKEKNIYIELLKARIDLDIIYLKDKSLKLKSTHIHSHTNKSNQISDISLSGQKLNGNLTGNIATTLSNQPNIGVTSFGAVTSKPVLRGYAGDRFLLVKDGNETGDLSLSAIDHAITLDMLEVNKIQIIRGPKSLIYGSNTIGGVINVDINGNPKLRAHRFIKSFIMGGESFNKGVYGNMMFYIPVKDNQINISISNRDTKNQTSPIGELENTYSETFNYKLGFTKYNKKGYFNFIFENFNMDYGIPPSLEGHINGVDIELIKNTFQINYHQDISIYNFDQFDFKYNFIDYEHQEFENNTDYFSVALAKNTHSCKAEFQSNNSVIGSELNYKYFFSRGFYWTPPTDKLELSLYGFYEKKFNRFDLLSSFKVGHLLIQPEEKDDSFYSNLNSKEIKNRNFNYFSYSVGFKKNIDNFEFNSWLMSTMKAPKIEELYSDGPHLGTYSYEIGSPNIELEKIYGFESSVNYNDNSFNISMSTFYNYSPYYYQMTKMGQCDEEYIEGQSHPCAGADFIEWGSGSAGWLYKYQIKGIEALVKGLEFNLRYNYKNIKIVYDFSLVRGDNLSEGIPLSYINPDKQILNLEYNKKILNYTLRLSKKHSQNRLGEFETPTASSFLTDFVIGYTNKNHIITVQFNNIFDQQHYNHLSRIKTVMPESGRNIIFNYKIII